MLPRTKDQNKLLMGKIRMRHRLTDYGFTVCTGQLVWNRHKDQLRDKPSERTIPLIWAESVLPDGTFRFKSIRANHKPFFELRENQEHLITKHPCVLVQRTTAKEQNRRLISAILPESFLEEFTNGVVIENHLNIVKSIDGNKISLEVINALFNSRVVDQVFRCISGSVAVSAYELNALPLPDLEYLEMLNYLIKNCRHEEQIEKYIANLYGVS
ncbi:hypothetical protein ES705_46389 [subsurface metagenome]